MSAGIEVSLDTEAVERELVSAIVNGGIGEKVKEAVDRALRGSYSGRSVVEDAIDAEIREQVRVRCRELIREPGPVHDLIEEKLRAALTEEALDGIVQVFVTDLGKIRTDDLA